MIRLYRWIVGSIRLTVPSAETERVLNFALKYNLPVWNVKKEENTFSFSLFPRHRKYFLKLFQTLSSDFQWKEQEEGSRVLLRRFGKRWGLMLGMTIFVFCLLLSVRLVWSVEVDGNVSISEAEICEKMQEIGLKPGVWIRSVNTGDFSLLFQVKNPEFSFASLNIIGTRAVLSVRERGEWNEMEESAPSSEGKANLVSSVSGTVLRYEVLAGQVMVKRGEVVPKGALLVSGVVERPNGAYRVVEAKGKVFAQTHRFFQVTVPFSRVKSAYTGNEETKKRYRILDFVFSPLDYEDSPYDRFNVTKSREQVEFLGKKLPIVCEIKTYHETEEKNKALTVDSAKNLAYDKYEEYKGENLLPGYKILEESASLTQNEEGLTLSVELTLEEDIATPLPFSYVESSEMERITNVRENH